MKRIKIYIIVATLVIIGLFIWIYSLKKELQETEEILEMCLDSFTSIVL